MNADAEEDRAHESKIYAHESKYHAVEIGAEEETAPESESYAHESKHDAMETGAEEYSDWSDSDSESEPYYIDNPIWAPQPSDSYSLSVGRNPHAAAEHRRAFEERVNTLLELQHEFLKGRFVANGEGHFFARDKCGNLVRVSPHLQARTGISQLPTCRRESRHPRNPHDCNSLSAATAKPHGNGKRRCKAKVDGGRNEWEIAGRGEKYF